MTKKEKKHSEFFSEITSSITEGIKAEKAGKVLTRHMVVVPDPPEAMSAAQIKNLRVGKLGVSPMHDHFTCNCKPSPDVFC